MGKGKSWPSVFWLSLDGELQPLDWPEEEEDEEGWEIVQVHKVCHFVLLITAITCTQDSVAEELLLREKKKNQEMETNGKR